MTDLKKISIFVLIPIFIFFTLSLVSADIEVIYPSPLPSTINLNPFSPTQIIEFENTNTSENIVLTFSVSSSLVDYVSLSKTTLNVGVSPYKGSVTLSIPVEGQGVGGSFSGYLTYSYTGGSGSLPLSVVIPPETEPVDSDIIVFPTSKIINVKQGNEKTQNILINVPENYPSPITISAVNFNPGTEPIIFGDLNLGQIAPGGSIQIPIIFSGVDAQTGTYQTYLSILATDSEGQVPLPQISLTLQVTAGVTPITDETFSSPPTCALSATIFNLNNTYSFTCSGVVSNLDLDIPSSDYFIGKNVETSSGLYKYEFNAVKFGETQFIASFKYKGASIFEPFKQDVLISSAGSQLPGSNLKFVFTPALENFKSGESVLIQLVDNKTGSLVSDPRLLIDAKEINRTGDFSFEYSFDSGKSYELRGKATGYDDFIQAINVSPKDIEIYISPEAGDVRTMFNITTSVANATITLMGREYVGNYYGTLTVGVVEIKASKSTYNTVSKNITITDTYRISEGGEDFSLRKEQVLKLNKNATSIIVLFMKSLADDRGSAEEYATATGDVLTFTPKKNGIYIIQADGVDVGTFEVEGFSFLNKWWIFPVWVWVLAILFVIIVIALIIRKKNIEKYNPQDEAGMTYPVGDAV